jgi:hypothetical protein
VNARRRSTARRLMPALLCAALPAACANEPQVPPDRLLVVDGIEITLGEVEPYVEFLGTYLPEGGRKSRIQVVLDEHVLPVRLAQRAFPEQRKRMLEQANALCAVATNVHELEQQSRLIEDKTRRNLTRRHRLPIVMFLFAPGSTGAVSPPLEVPYGYVVVGAYEMKEAPLMVDDYVDALLVGFPTHQPSEWKEWIEGEKQRVATKVSWVHPDYREAMPQWLQLPKLP